MERMRIFCEIGSSAVIHDPAIISGRPAISQDCEITRTYRVVNTDLGMALLYLVVQDSASHVLDGQVESVVHPPFLLLIEGV